MPSFGVDPFSLRKKSIATNTAYPVSSITSILHISIRTSRRTMPTGASKRERERERERKRQIDRQRARKRERERAHTVGGVVAGEPFHLPLLHHKYRALPCDVISIQFATTSAHTDRNEQQHAIERVCVCAR